MVFGFGSGFKIKMQFSGQDLLNLKQLVDRLAEESQSEKTAQIFNKYPNLNTTRHLLLSVIGRARAEIYRLEEGKTYSVSDWESMFQNINQLMQFISSRILKYPSNNPLYYYDLVPLLNCTSNLANCFDVIIKKIIAQESQFVGYMYQVMKLNEEVAQRVRSSIRRVA